MLMNHCSNPHHDIAMHIARRFTNDELTAHKLDPLAGQGQPIEFFSREEGRR